jgi:hypothetical protein
VDDAPNRFIISSFRFYIHTGDIASLRGFLGDARLGLRTMVALTAVVSLCYNRLLNRSFSWAWAEASWNMERNYTIQRRFRPFIRGFHAGYNSVQSDLTLDTFSAVGRRKAIVTMAVISISFGELD